MTHEEPKMLDMGSLPERHARFRGQHPAFLFGGKMWTWQQFNEEVIAFGRALNAAGLGKGDHFATVLPNGLELMAAWWAAARTGTVIVPLSPLLQATGLARLIEQSDARLVIGHVAFAGELAKAREDAHSIGADGWILAGDAPDPPGFRRFDAFLSAGAQDSGQRPAIAPDDPINIMYSSGTTGLPKGIVHTHAVRAMYALIFAQSCRIGPESVVLHAGSIVFNGAMIDLMPWMLAGATYILHERFDPAAVIEDIEAQGVTHIIMVPAQIIALLNHQRYSAVRLSSLQMLMSLGAPLPDRCKDQLQRELPGRFQELYGVTEGIMTVLDRNEVSTRPGSVGCPPSFMTVAIRREDGSLAERGEVGEIVGRGPCLMAGYHGQPEVTRQVIRDGWLHTGDAGYLDGDGYLYLVDRIKDIIISGGVNVYPGDIEDVVAAHPGVHEVAVLGVADERWGEVPVAVVTGQGINADELKAWVNERVDARFQRLHEVRVVDSFPRNVAGKILKRELRSCLFDQAN
jgi:long-chain acyl-CoA synthetase